MHTLQATRDVRKVSLWLGHASIKSTEIYLRADPTEKLAILNAGVAPNLRPGRFHPPDRLLAMLRSSCPDPVCGVDAYTSISAAEDLESERTSTPRTDSLCILPHVGGHAVRVHRHTAAVPPHRNSRNSCAAASTSRPSMRRPSVLMVMTGVAPPDRDAGAATCTSRNCARSSHTRVQR